MVLICNFILTDKLRDTGRQRTPNKGGQRGGGRGGGQKRPNTGGGMRQPLMGQGGPMSLMDMGRPGMMGRFSIINILSVF